MPPEDDPKERTKDEERARIAALIASGTMFVVSLLGICAVFLPWWVGASGTKIVSRGVGHIGLDSDITLWGYDLTMRVPITPDSPELHTAVISSDWSIFCRDEEIRIRAWPTECVTIEVARAFSILTAILALGATVALMYGVVEPLSLLGGAALGLLTGVCAAVGVVCGVITATDGLVGIGFFLLVACAVCSWLSVAVTLFAASKAMPSEAPVLGMERDDVSRFQRAKDSREQEAALAMRLELGVRSHMAADAVQRVGGGGPDDEEPPKPVHSYVHVTRVIEWLQDRSKLSEPIPEQLLEDAFKEIDRDHSGSIDLDELVAALQASGLPTTQAAAQALLKDIDKDASNDIDIMEFFKFFESARELENLQNRTESSAKFLTIVCSSCFLFHIVLVGVLLMIFIQTDEAEAGPDNYSIMRNALFVCCLNLGLLFVIVILIPAIQLTLGANVAAWRRHYDKRFSKVKKKRPGSDSASYECRFRCGYRGSVKEVQTHEKNCPAKGNKPLPQGGLRQAGWSGGQEEAPSVNAAIFGASYRVRKAQQRLAELNRDWRECPNGCGFSGTNEEVSQHEYVCPLRRKATKGAAADDSNAPPPPGVILNEDGGMERYDPLAFRMEQMNQLSQRPLTTFVSVAGRDTAQFLAAERTANPNVQLPALTDYTGNYR